MIDCVAATIGTQMSARMSAIVKSVAKMRLNQCIFALANDRINARKDGSAKTFERERRLKACNLKLGHDVTTRGLSLMTGLIDHERHFSNSTGTGANLLSSN